MTQQPLTTFLSRLTVHESDGLTVQSNCSYIWQRFSNKLAPKWLHFWTYLLFVVFSSYSTTMTHRLWKGQNKNANTSDTMKALKWVWNYNHHDWLISNDNHHNWLISNDNHDDWLISNDNHHDWLTSNDNHHDWLISNDNHHDWWKMNQSLKIC